MSGSLIFFFIVYGDHRYLHALTHSFPPRRSSDLTLLDHARTEPVADLGELLVRKFDQPRGQGEAAIQVLHVLVRHGALVAHVVIELGRSEEHTSELQSLMRISYAVFCLIKKTNKQNTLRHIDTGK